MATMLVTIICIAMFVLGSMTLSQGIMISADTASFGFESINLRESEMIRTKLEIDRAAPLAWADLLRVTIRNSGQTRLAMFDRWDFIVNYTDAAAGSHSTWLKYVAGTPAANQWQKARIGLDGPVDFFEPDILNPQEEMVALGRLDPLPGDDSSGIVTVVAPNGVFSSGQFFSYGQAILTPHGENTTIAGVTYYELEEACLSDGSGLNFRQDFAKNEGGRKLLFNESAFGRQARFIFPLIGIDQIPAATWTVYYRCFVSGEGQFPRADGDVRFDIDIAVRQADGSVRAILATAAAGAYIDKSDQGLWLTKSATLAFPGYTIVDPDDYLEVVFYGATDLGPNGGDGYLLLRIDDLAVAENEQTRIES